jgi:hypothetical protein
MARLPKNVREAISRRILERASSEDWPDLTNNEKSRLYEEWVQDPNIGGRLSEYIARSRVRVWIKDGPMKEYSRAARGLGPYAHLMPDQPSYEFDIARGVLGEGWTPIDGTITWKPNQFQARSGDRRIHIYWGTERDLKHLVWAYVTHTNDADPRIVVAVTQQHPVGDQKLALHKSIGEKIGTEISYVILD